MNKKNRLSGTLLHFNHIDLYGIILMEDGSKWFVNKDSFEANYSPSKGDDVFFIPSKLKGENLGLYVSRKD